MRANPDLHHFTRDDFAERVRRALITHEMVPPGTHVTAAVSGGADSVVLLHLLHRFSGPRGFTLSAVHVNLHLRGEESDCDECWVRALAGRLQIDLTVFHEPISTNASNLEETAREARRRVYRRLVAERTDTRVALGHTRSDQAETVLFRTLRGTGLKGLSGMQWVTSDGLIRPLLGVSRHTVRDWARANGIEWREDSSNLDARFRRNFLRNDLLPRIESHVNSEVESTLARMAEVAQAEEEYWDSVIAPLFDTLIRPAASGIYFIDLQTFRPHSLAVKRRLLRRAFEQIRGDLRQITSAHVDAVLGLCGSDAGHDRVLIPGIDALRSFSTLRLSTPRQFANQKRHYSIPVSPDSDIELPFSAGAIRVNSRVDDVESPQNYVKFVSEKDRSEFVSLDFEALGGPAVFDRLVVRNWEPGDAYQPAGHQHNRKIKELFQENKVLLWERRHWPVLDREGEIVWVRQFGPASKFRAEQGQRRAVSLIYRAGA
jgi:tRNA(Ile)-lysidine synthase